jgi:hypothetical protein
MAPAYQPGRYMIKISAQGFSESSEKKTPFFFLEGTPVGEKSTDGQFYETAVKYPRTIRMYVTDGTFERVHSDIKKLGWPGGKFSTLDPNSPGFHSFIDQEIEVECKHEASIKNDGTMSEKWELPYEGKPREATASDARLASKLDAKFGKKLGPAPAKRSAAKPLAKQPELATADADPDASPF